VMNFRFDFAKERIEFFIALKIDSLTCIQRRNARLNVLPQLLVSLAAFSKELQRFLHYTNSSNSHDSGSAA
jgi:hypothetical protein